MKQVFSRLMPATAILLILSLFVIPKEAIHAEIADGTYQVNYEMKEAGNNNTSIANGYFTSPSTLTVKNGVKHIQLTITSSSMVKSLSTPTGPVDIVSEDKNNETRTVRFRVNQDLSKPLSMEMHIVVPDLYDTTHTARAVFDTSGLKTTSQKKETKENQSESKANQDKQQNNNKQEQTNTKKRDDTSQSAADKKQSEQTDSKDKDSAERSDQETEQTNDDDKDTNDANKDKDGNDGDDDENDIGKNVNEAGSVGEMDAQIKPSQKNESTSNALWISLAAIGIIIIAGLVFWILRKKQRQ